MQSIRDSGHYRLHGLLSVSDVACGGPHDLDALLRKARDQLTSFPDRIDAIVGFWDFPTVLMMPILREDLGLRGPTLESVLRCEHKYWSRLQQKEVVPDCVPLFTLVDPFASPSDVRLSFPFWLKPIKAHSSLLGFRIRNQTELLGALARIRAGIHIFAEPMNAIMRHAVLPNEVAWVHGGYCIAEKIISHGRQCTLEGFVFDGDIEVYGVVDSIRARNRSSFIRYEYPSCLPLSVQSRMKDIARRVVARSGLNWSPFNMELFYESARDHISLLEINARISKSHSPLFEKVDGVPHDEVMVEVALGKRPRFPMREGKFRHAAKFMPRVFNPPPDAILLDVADDAEIKSIEERFPGTHIELSVTPGMKVSASHHRDSYSHQLATIFMGANSHTTLMKNYAACLRALRFQVGSPENAHVS
ncbi:MAG: acetyl-CoA carboxylase biotin carboxylase subunit family protein [Myxococcota bacterium]